MSGDRRGGRWILGAALLALTAAAPAAAASRAELTWLPCGAIRLPRGDAKIWFNLPHDYKGILPHPMVFLAFYVPDPNVTPEPTTQTTSGPVIGEANLRIKVGDKRLPDWIVEKKNGSAYVINLETIAGNPMIGEKRVLVDFSSEMFPGEVWLYGLGAPDPLVVSDKLDGPLSLFIEKAPDADVRTYFEGLAAQFANAPEKAGDKFRAAAKSKNDKIAMYARRGLRLLRSIQRSKKEREGFANHYRWGLFSQQCGFFQAAMDEFSGCVNEDDRNGSVWYRLGEVVDQCGFPIAEAAANSERAGQALGVRDPTVWNVLVTFLRKRDVQVVENGQTVTKTLQITQDDINRLKEEWIIVEKLVFGASRGTLRLNTTFFSIPDETTRPFVKHCGWLTGPPDNIVEERGWFDSVISIRPHTATERDETGGGDVGPNGAALSDVGADADWQRLLRHLYHQLDWTLIVGETGPGAPLTNDGVGCGVSPIPSAGFGLRAAMRYYMTPAMFRHAKVVPTTRPPKWMRDRAKATSQPTTAPATASRAADEDEPKTYLRYWRVFGPVRVNDAWPETGEAASHVLDSVPTSQPAPSRVIDSETGFVDLKGSFGNDGGMLARAVCWVKSPVVQHVQMWIGQNDRAAVWVNGRCVHRGQYASTCNYLDSTQVDQIASFATLDPGWNRIEVAVEGWPEPRNKGWGFSIRLTTFDGDPVPGMRVTVHEPVSELAPQYLAPEINNWYSWTRCESAFHEMIPRLTEADLQALTGLRGLRVHGRVSGADGMIALEAPGRKEGATYRRVPTEWRAEADRDVRLNNLLDWAREDVLAVRYEKDGHVHDLLILKPEASEAYLTLLKEPPEATSIFGQLAPANRVLGYLPVPAEAGSSRSLIVADVLFTPEGQDWPIDEEDLMDPKQ